MRTLNHGKTLQEVLALSAKDTFELLYICSNNPTRESDRLYMNLSNPPVTIIPTETYFSMVRQQLAATGRAYVSVTGNSISPLLRHLRDGVTVLPPKTILRGDIVLFDRMNGHYALHRVIQTNKTGFAMAGDNQWHIETDLSYQQVVGVVSEIIRDGKTFSIERHLIKGYTLLVVIVAKPRIYIYKVIKKALKTLKFFCHYY